MCRKYPEIPPFLNRPETILIIDEIQISFDAYNSIRDLRASLHCDIIVTGSYLGQTLKKEFFQPAGTVTSLSMHTLSFQEFCRVFGAEEMCREKRGSGRNSIEVLTELTKRSTKAIITREEISSAVMWLRYCNIIGCCHLASNGDINDIQYDRRTYFMDCGIASCIAGDTTLPHGALEGLITETFVFNELYRLFHTSQEEPVVKGALCFSIYNQYELDFMLAARDNTIYGLEVKTGTGAPRSLKVFIDRHLVDKGIVAKKTRGGHGGAFDSIPVFAVGVRFPYC